MPASERERTRRKKEKNVYGKNVEAKGKSTQITNDQTQI